MGFSILPRSLWPGLFLFPVKCGENPGSGRPPPAGSACRKAALPPQGERRGPAFGGAGGRPD